MMMSMRRYSGWRATYVAGGLMFLVAMNPASAGIISDRSAFLGDFTVIDFESRGDGTPLSLDEGQFFRIDTQEYSAIGVTITSSGNIFGGEEAIIANDGGLQSDAAQQMVGSLPNLLTAGAREAFLRLEFSPSVDAFGVAALVRSDGLPVTLEVFDVSGNLLDIVVFEGDLIDGIVRGADFANDFDVSFGFLGYSSPDAQIGYAILSEDLASFDDLHFGAVPDTSTLYLLSSGLLLILLLRKKAFVFRRSHAALVIIAVILSAPGVLWAETVIGTVTGYVMTSEDPICGDNGPPWCDQQPLEQVPLHDVRVCESGLFCTFTDAQGDYQLTVTDGVPVDIEADLDGQRTKVGRFEEIDEVLVFIVSPALVVTFDPAAPPLDNRIDFVFNANPNPVSEIPTVEANIFHHTMLVREFWLERHPSFTGLDVQIASTRNGVACKPAFYIPPALLMSFPKSGPNFGTDCVAKADRSIVAHEYGHVIHNALGLDDSNAEEEFREGFGDTVALLVYDFPDLFMGHGGDGTFKSYDFAPPANAQRIVWPCTSTQCPPRPNSVEPDPNCCGSIRAGIWWDIKLNMQAKYTAAGAPDCPIDPALTGTDACGLELTRQLFVDWSKVTNASPVDFMLAEILDLDDDDGDLWNGSPNFAEICRAFRDHGIDCPFDCNEDGRHDLDNIADQESVDSDENQVPDECEGEGFDYKIAYVNAGAGGANNGSTWHDAFTSLRVALQHAAVGVDEIWVAAGKYTTVIGSADPNRSFALGGGMRVYGGFVGGEDRLTQRDPVENETILSGDLNGADCRVCSSNSPRCDNPWGGLCVDGCCAVPDNYENSRTVVNASALGSSASTLLDGFTITAGNGEREEQDGDPGGMFIAGRPTVRNCRFVGNFGGSNGGAVAFSGFEAKPLFQNCRFENNSAPDIAPDLQRSGGAVFFDSGSRPRFVDCSFVQNSAGNEGGAVGSIDSAPTFIRCTFEGNSAPQGGGLMLRRPDLRGRGASLIDCVFRENNAGLDGGGLHVDATSATLSGCLFHGNNAGNFGGGMYNVNPNSDKITITDCIFGGNTAAEKGGAIYDGGDETDVLNTLIVWNEATNGEGGGVYANSDTKYLNCTISHNRGVSGATGDGVFQNLGFTTIRNCILWANQGLDGLRTDVDQFQPSGQGFSISAIIVDTGTGADDPLFRDPQDDDFRLSVDSPAKEVGTNSFLPAGVVTDLDGGPRIDGPFVDLGPYEWSDCNSNNTDDGGDIFSGTSFDCNNNGLPDECDIAGGTSEDCTNNLIPDECEPDCQPNGVADSCDIAGTSADAIGPTDGIPDECQVDCNGNQIPDQFDLVGNDCNFNGMPDECDDDGDNNGIPDDCASPPLPAAMGCDSDLDCSSATGISCTQDSDCAGTEVDRCSAGLCRCPGGVDSECESGALCGPGFVCQILGSEGARCSDPTVPPTPRFCECPGGDDAACLALAECISDLCYVPRNKYVSFQPEISRQNGNDTGYRLKLIASASLPDCVDEIRWVGEPAADGTALLIPTGDEPRYSDIWPDVVHIGDELIAPDSTYEIVAVFYETGYSSAEVEFPTARKPGVKHWGDAVGGFDGVRWTPPNGTVNIDDALAAVMTYQDKNGYKATHISITDVHGSYLSLPIPNRLINILDVYWFVLAFQGADYPWKVPGCNLPWVPPDPLVAPPLVAPPSTLSLVFSSTTIAPNQTVDVEVFLDVDEEESGALNLAAYQLLLEVTGGDAGTLDLESRFITAREDYVFDGLNTLESIVDVGGHIAAFDLDAVGVAVAVGSSVYLGTFQFRASSDAAGAFYIGFPSNEENSRSRGSVGSEEYFLINANGLSIQNLIAEDGMFVEVKCVDDTDCDDGNECTDDTCINEACSNVGNDTNTCTDGNDCTDDSCSGGVCVSVNDDSNTCTDGSVCTYGDACVSGVCTTTNEPVGTSCDDGLFCTGTDECDGSGTCAGSGSPCGSRNPYCCEYLSICTVLPCQ